ncbi:uncharacterized protein LOC115819677 [Chanos chanos]|uniref:Uncharacterized protein LOC115819677 n=1 Tax=Chanos chanos TaxID=29144 RepID=A0A6J2W4K1_CHACN|nr:uncharacterized protein LOC115819677 [Chanos chanos]
MSHSGNNGSPQTFNDKDTLNLPESYQNDWMSLLDDNKFISDITIPGTHDTMALHGGPAAECQAWKLEDQLKAGIRYLDLRVFAFEGELYTMHGVMYEHSTLNRVLDTVTQFLSEFRSETVLVRIKPDLFNKDEVQEMVEQVIKGYDNVWVDSAIPTVGQVRGMIVFVQKSSFQLGIPEKETDTKGDYEVIHISHKEEETAQHLKQAVTECGRDFVVLTYSSGTGIGTFEGMFLTPKKVAEKMDPWLYDYLKNLSAGESGQCFGIIAMDFPGLDLIQMVISLNM